MIRVLNAEPLGYSPEAAAILREVAQVDLLALDRPGVLDRVGACDALIVRLGFRVDEELLSAGQRLRAVASATTGLDHIDLDAAAAHGVQVVSLKGEFEFLETIHATSEHTWALLLALLRRLPEASAAAKAGPWDRDALRGRELHGKTLGVVGLGRVGRKVAAYGRAFGMRVLAADPRLDPEEPPAGLEVRELDDLLAESDIVSLHVPLEPATTGLIDAARLALMRPTALLINTARGAVLDEAALVTALEEGRLAGAALDVLSGEARLRAEGGLHHPLVALAQREPGRVLLTPHIAGATFESMRATEIFIARKLVATLRSLCG